MKTVRTRVAPSPTGFPHVGTLYQALFDFVWAKKNEGKFILRIEDTDAKREVEGAEQAIFDAFSWAGLNADEGPNSGGEFGPYRQSERLTLYKKYAEELIEKGFAYYCFCDETRLETLRKEQEAKKLPPRYDRFCRDINPQEAKKRVKAGEKACIRMKIPDHEKIKVTDLIRGEIEFDSDTLDDQVILKSDGFPTYHLAVVVDDHLMEISHAIRGEEWLPSAPKHVLLYRYMNWVPPVFVHLPILRNPDHSKMSKRQGLTSVFWYRDEGYLPEALLNYLASIVWNHPEGKEIFGIPDLIKYFEFKDMSYAAPIFDLTKLEWMSGVYLRGFSVEQFIDKMDEYRNRLGKRNLLETLGMEKLRKIIPLVQERIKKLSEFGPSVDFFFVSPHPLLVRYEYSLQARYLDKIPEMLDMMFDRFTKLSDFSAGSIHNSVNEIVTATGWKKADFCMMMRIAITGKTISAPLFESMEIIGRDASFERLGKAKEVVIELIKDGQSQT
ncbi:glutamate--tRNA ligase [candidate division WWE3 bacterium CG08_land_8_20_14_0_20_41_15]|uniref:Glutamate--tRNA ligase n=1 Tax=candidate division WWE3 bacterium CG08_land_8_20_14_0_20_41_15 TaxID=1975086 RepID=A0A2H0XAJ3_UNCKA|nr:MAG: glutamate--tRNA ligase [candidate division WWE3 bacterium CG08_land_8_20_14_0_20_41_15]